MGSVKTVFLAGTALVVLSLSARAADYLPPPPMMPAAAPVGELGSGWYLRGDVGYVSYRDPKEAPYSTVPIPKLDDPTLSKEWSLGGGVGFKLNDWFRTDLTVDHRIRSRFHATSSRTGYLEGYSTDMAEFSSTSFLLNGYLDLGHWWGVTPYVGAGVGFARNKLHDYTTEVTCLVPSCGLGPGFNFPTGGQGAVPQRSGWTTDLAWALMAGVAVNVGHGFKLDLGYRYVNLGPAKNQLDAFGIGTKLKSIEAHEARVGFRYMID
jgi:opacity protein-like surface antigen